MNYVSNVCPRRTGDASPSTIVTAVRRIRKGNIYLTSSSLRASSATPPLSPQAWKPGSGGQVPWFRWHQWLRRDFLAGPPELLWFRPPPSKQYSRKTMTFQEFYTSLAPYVDIQVPTRFLVRAVTQGIIEDLMRWLLSGEQWVAVVARSVLCKNGRRKGMGWRHISVKIVKALQENNLVQKPQQIRSCHLNCFQTSRESLNYLLIFWRVHAKGFRSFSTWALMPFTPCRTSSWSPIHLSRRPGEHFFEDTKILYQHLPKGADWSLRARWDSV